MGEARDRPGSASEVDGELSGNEVVQSEQLIRLVKKRSGKGAWLEENNMCATNKIERERLWLRMEQKQYEGRWARQIGGVRSCISRVCHSLSLCVWKFCLHKQVGSGNFWGPYAAVQRHVNWPKLFFSLPSLR